MLDIRFTIPALPVVIPAALAAAAIVAVIAHRHGVGRRLMLWRLLAVAYGAAVIGVTFFPLQVVLGRYAGSGEWWSSVNWLPILTIDLRTFVLNVLLMVPFGVLVPVLTRWQRLESVIAAGFIVSAGIEVLQYAGQKLLSTGRTADVNDVIANVLGTLLGYAVFRIVAAMPAVAERVLPFRDPQEKAVDAPAPAGL